MKKKIVLVVGVLFLAAMAAVTLAARNRYQLSLPQVTLDIPRAASIALRYEADGIVEASGDGAFEVNLSFALADWVGSFPFSRGDAATVCFAEGLAEGEITCAGMARDGSALEACIQFDAFGVQEGQEVLVILEKQTPEVPTVLPLSALQNDGEWFVWLVEETPGPWGSEYILKKEYVSVWYMGREQAALKEPISLPVVTSADGLIMEGRAVRFYP